MKISVFLATKGKGTDDRRMRQVCFRVREGASDLRVRSGLLANEDYWDESIPGYRRTTKLPKGEINGLNKKIQDITVLIHEQFSENRDGSWLRGLVRNYLENGTENWVTSVSSFPWKLPVLTRTVSSNSSAVSSAAGKSAREGCAVCAGH